MRPSAAAHATPAPLCPSTARLLVSCHMAQPANPNLAPRPARPPEPVTSHENRWLKQFRAALAGESLRAPRASASAHPTAADRESTPDEVVGLEGARLVETALRSRTEIIAVLVSAAGARHLPSLAALIPSGARILSTTDRLFAQISGTEAPQGIAALLRPRVATFDDLVCGTPLIVIMAGLQDPGNVGALIRTAEAFGATGVAACITGGAGTANPFGPKALRASAGSALRLPILRGIAAPVLLAQLRIAGVRVYAACPDDVRSDPAAQSSRSPCEPLTPWEVDWRAPSALLMGNEGAGLPPDLVRSADAAVRIPQANAGAIPTPVDSLNVALAGGILLYEAARQRGLT
jgi:RNA methyltransferase, TrmH family